MTLQAALDRLSQDVRYALRGIKRSPGFTLAIVGTLGLGIGVNGAMFTLLDRLFVQAPAAIARPAELRRLYKDHRPRGESGVNPLLIYPEVRGLRDAVDSAILIGAYTPPESTSIVDGFARIPIRRSLANNDYFSVLGVRPAAGRFFDRGEANIATQTPVAVVSDALWRKAFNRDRNILGKNVKIAGHETTIVGIAPPGFVGPDVDAIDVWMPANMYEGGGGGAGAWYNTHGARFLTIIRPASQAEEERVARAGTAVVETLALRGERWDSTGFLRTGPILRAMGPADQGAEVIVATRVAGVALLVLIIAGANVTNLFLLRAAQRRREIAVRQALGVSRMRLAQQFTIESVMLALGGGVVAAVFAAWANLAIRRLVLPRVQWASGPVDLRTIAFIAAVAAGIGVVAGLLTATAALGHDVNIALKVGTRSAGYRRSKLRATLVAVQAGLSLVLIVGAGLFIKSLTTVESIDVGYDREDLYFIRPAFDGAGARGVDLRAALPEAAQRLRAMDDVVAVAYTSVPPLQGAMFRSIYLPGMEDHPQLPGDYGPSIVTVSPDYFRATGLPVRQGRAFTDADRRDAPPVMIVGESLARLFWPGESPLGKCIHFPKRTSPCFAIVGTVADAHRMRIIEGPIGQVYIPFAQGLDAPIDLIVRTRPGRGQAIIRAAEQTLRPLATGMVGVRARSFASVLEPQLRPWRLGATLFTALGVLALSVAAIGVYSIVAYGVSQRIGEMGIRIALGARARDILDLVVGDGLKIVAIGVVAGALASLVLGRLIASLLFGVLPTDPSVLIASACTLCIVAVLACLIPAWRASRVDPVASLRAD